MADYSSSLFSPVEGYWFTAHLLKLIESRTGCFETTLDIGLTRRTICVSNGAVIVDDISILIDDVEPSEEDRVVLVEKDSLKIYEVLVHANTGFYKLKAIGFNKAPTIEINGIHMHRISGTDPWTDTFLKIRAAKIKNGMKVLDTCMGLGYTSIMSIKQGAIEVHTFEIDPFVKWIAERNSWSRQLSDPNIRIHIGDVVKHIVSLPDNYFDRVIHDPPRFTRHTGDLYSYEFYFELNRVLRPGGLLFHYTGEPHKHGGPSILKGIKERLERAGFRVMRYDREAFGFIGYKLN